MAKQLSLSRDTEFLKKLSISFNFFKYLSEAATVTANVNNNMHAVRRTRKNDLRSGFSTWMSLISYKMEDTFSWK